MKKEFYLLVLFLALVPTTKLFGSAASTFAGTTPMTNSTPTPFALMLPTEDTNTVATVSTMTFEWNPVLNYEFGPVTYDIGMRLNAASNFFVFANTAMTNHTTTNVPTVKTEYAVRAVSTNMVGSNLVRSAWSTSVFAPPDPPTNVFKISLLSVPSAASTNWTVVTNFAHWTNPPTIMPGAMALWKMQTNRITTNITELVVMKSSNLVNWSQVYTVTRWTNTPPSTRWKLDFSKSPL